VLVWYASETHCTNRIASDGIDISRKQLEASNRAWVGIEGGVDFTSLAISKDGIGAEYAVSLKNFGVSPAVHVNLSAMIVPSESDFGPETQHFKNYSDATCMMADDPRPARPDIQRGYGLVMFPKGTIRHPENQSANISITESSMLKIVGCIAYTVLPSNTIHHTRFCFVSEESALSLGNRESKAVRLFACTFGNTAD
jgi:hypothetical protein